jgi:hypothetical protein
MGPILQSSLLAIAILLGASGAAAAEPIVVDPWLEQPLSEIIDPWAGSAEKALYATDEIVDPWQSYWPKIPTAAFPLID